ncbi:MAG: hypothetical protein ABFS56_20950 [Pseudomonadota bacterium]
MKRRHGDNGQILFSDLAMAALGPMAALMIIFLLLAAKPCPPCPICKQLNEQEMDKWALELREWVAKMENLMVNKTLPTIACDNFSSSKIYEIDGTPIIPPSLYDLCPEDAMKVLEMAELSKDKLNQLMSDYQNAMRERYLSLASNIAKCVKVSPEKFTVTSKEIEFKTCSTTFVNPTTQKPMTVADKQRFFDEITAKIVMNLFENPEYNRIDIFGHSDKRPINKGGCLKNGAKNNRQLSSFRVHAFLDEIEGVLRRNQERAYFYQVVERLENFELKIYAIGVGEKEPLDTGNSREAYRKNRRIEIRFGVDRRVK